MFQIYRRYRSVTNSQKSRNKKLLRFSLKIIENFRSALYLINDSNIFYFINDNRKTDGEAVTKNRIFTLRMYPSVQ